MSFLKYTIEGMEFIKKRNEAYPGEFKIIVVRDIVENGLSILEAYEKYFPEAKGRIAWRKLNPQKYKYMLRLFNHDELIEKFEKNYVPPNEEERRQLMIDLKKYPYQRANINFIKKWIDLYYEGGEARLMENRRIKRSFQEPIAKVEISKEEIKSIISKLAHIRIQAGLTGRVLSNAIGRSDDYISKMENNDTLPSLEVVLAILKACKVNASDFFKTFDC